MTFGEGGLHYSDKGVERFRSGFRVIFDDDDKVVSVECLEEFAKVSESEQKQTSKIVDYS